MSFRKSFWEINENNWRTKKKQVKALEVLKSEENKEEIKSVEGVFPKGMRTNEIKNQTDEIKKWEEKVRRKDLVYKTNKYKYGFLQYETISLFGDSIYNSKISIDEAGIDQRSLLDGLRDFNDRSRPKTAEGKNKK